MIMLKDTREYFEERGFKPCRKQSSRKYLKMTHPQKESVVWLGKRGAVRVGPTIKDSFSISGSVERIIRKRRAES